MATRPAGDRGGDDGIGPNDLRGLTLNDVERGPYAARFTENAGRLAPDARLR